MKKTLFFGLVILAAAAFFLYPKAPQMTGIENFKLPKMDARTLTIQGDAKFTNPNFFGLTVEGYEIDVLVSEKKVGQIESNEKRPIEPKTDFSIPVTVTFEKREVFGGSGFFRNLIKSAVDNEMKAHYKGEVRVSVLGMVFPVAVDYTQNLLKHGLGDEVVD